MQTGALLTGILIGDLCISLVLTTRADTWGRRKTLVVGSALKVLAGAAFASTANFSALLAAGSWQRQTSFVSHRVTLGVLMGLDVPQQASWA